MSTTIYCIKWLENIENKLDNQVHVNISLSQPQMVLAVDMGILSFPWFDLYKILCKMLNSQFYV